MVQFNKNIRFYAKMIYDIAELRIDIRNKLKYTDKFCEKYLSPDQTSQTDMVIEVTDEEFKAEKGNSSEFSDGYIENLCIYRKICNRAPEFDRFLFHCSVVEHGGNAYAFSGKSGAGKSTHSKLWLKYLPEAKILNGDKPIIGYKNGEFFVYGTPWQGKEGFGYNGKAKLKSVCFIRQAKFNKISPIAEGEFADAIFSQTLMPPTADGALKTLELLDKLVKTVPAFVLDCDISKDAFDTAFEGLTRGNL